MKKLEKLSSKLKDYINKRNFIYMITENTKALLAAGLIGTASLGMQSCAQPTDDYTNPAPTEEVKPKDNETPPPAPAVTTDDTNTDKTPAPAADNNNEEKTRDNGGENTVKEITIGSKTIKVTSEEAADLTEENSLSKEPINDDSKEYSNLGLTVRIYNANGFEQCPDEGYSGYAYWYYAKNKRTVYIIPTTIRNEAS